MKAQFPGAIMFFRLGDFYEMFDDDALTGARELELTLTSREFARGERAPMCGVPYHAAETYIARLVARGYKVAICALIGPRRNRYLAAAIIKGDDAGVAYCDATTGEISTMALHGRPVAQLVERELMRVAPSELLWPRIDGTEELPFSPGEAFVTPFEPRFFSFP